MRLARECDVEQGSTNWGMVPVPRTLLQSSTYGSCGKPACTSRPPYIARERCISSSSMTTKVIAIVIGVSCWDCRMEAAFLHPSPYSPSCVRNHNVIRCGISKGNRGGRRQHVYADFPLCICVGLLFLDLFKRLREMSLRLCSFLALLPSIVCRSSTLAKLFLELI